MIPTHPVYVPSKNRYQEDRALTAKALMRDGVPFRMVVEPTEAEDYARLVGEHRVLVFDEVEVGRGSIPARNWIRRHAIAEGHEKHHQLDDNILEWRRLWKGYRIPCDAGAALRVVEELSDRYENVGVSGHAYQMFCPAETRAPVKLNCHIYSSTLINHAMPYVWRGRYNEDTDLCLQALANGWATLLVNAFHANKLATMVSKGGNTDQLYTGGESEDDAAPESHTDTMKRYQMAKDLERAWPGVVKVTRKFGRYQHTVNWGAFADVRPRLRGDVTVPREAVEGDLRLVAVKPPRSSDLAALLETYERDVASADPPAHWGGLPAFIPFEEPRKGRVIFRSAEEQEALVAALGVRIAKRTKLALSCWYPPRDRQDLSSLRFQRADA